MSAGLLFGAALMLLAAALGLQALLWLLKGLVTVVGYLLSLLAAAAWVLLHPHQAARVWREAGRRHAAG